VQDSQIGFDVERSDRLTHHEPMTTEAVVSAATAGLANGRTAF
jgi:hypothetical protein